MNHFQHSLLIEADPAAVHAALVTAEGLRGWWTRDCDIDSGGVGVGSTLRFRFGPHHKTMRVEALDAHREVRWLCTAAHLDVDAFKRKDEWVGTRIVFRLVPDGTGRTRLDFEHVGLLPELECHAVCSSGWGHYLESLQRYAQTGRGMPYEPTNEPTIESVVAG